MDTLQWLGPGGIGVLIGTLTTLKFGLNGLRRDFGEFRKDTQKDLRNIQKTVNGNSTAIALLKQRIEQ